MVSAARRGLRRIRRAFNVGLRAFYDAAAYNQFTSNIRTQIGLGADEPYIADHAVLIARIDDLVRNNAVAASAVRAFVDVVLPAPVVVEPRAVDEIEPTDDFDGPSDAMNRAWNNPLLRIWNEWGEGSCDYNGWPSHRSTLATMQEQWATTNFKYAEVFVVFRNRRTRPGLPSLQLQTLDTKWLDTSRIDTANAMEGRRAGIEYDENGRPVAYWFRNPSGGIRADSERVLARNVAHAMIPHAPSAMTGHLSLAAALMSIKLLKDVVQSELASRAVVSRIWGALVGGDMLAEGDGPNGSVIPPEASIIRLAEAGQFQQINPSRPESTFPQTVEVFMRWIAAATGLPYSRIAANYTGLNYTVSRAERMSYRAMAARYLQNVHIAQIMRPVYHRFVARCIEEGLVQPPINMSLAQLRTAVFRAPKDQWIDPTKEFPPLIAAVQAGLISPQAACESINADFFAGVDERAEAERYARKRGVTLGIFMPPAGTPVNTSPNPTPEPSDADD